MAVSPLSITASAPSSTALATSLTSLLLGLVRSSMLSIICVATITGLARCIHFLIISFCTTGTCSIGISTPKSPRATITASLSTIISRRFFSASGISILAITFILLLLAFKIFFRLIMSSAFLTKESATQSSLCSMINSRSAKSFSVIDGMVSTLSGRLTPFLGVSTPPNVTRIKTSLSFNIFTTLNSILPSSKNIRSPAFTSVVRLGYETYIFWFVPTIFSMVKINSSPSFKISLPFSNSPTRNFGPCKSPNKAILYGSSFIILLTWLITASLSS